MNTYVVITGNFYDPAMALLGTGYSGGDSGAVPEAVNNPQFEGIVDVGPIVSGNYTRGKIFPQHPILGHYVIQLVPDAPTSAKITSYGRNPASFFVHGDNITEVGKRAGSDGCIVLALGVRLAFGTGVDANLQVVNYSPAKMKHRKHHKRGWQATSVPLVATKGGGMKAAILQNWLTTTFGILAGLPLLVTQALAALSTQGYPNLALSPALTHWMLVLTAIGLIGLGIVSKAFNTHSTQAQVAVATIDAGPKQPVDPAKVAAAEAALAAAKKGQ